MAKCPRCGAEVVDPVKSWSMIGKPDRSGEMFKLTIGLYNCICSDRSFRSVIGKEKITLRGVLEKNNSLEEQLMEATSKKSELECVVKALEDEKAQLLAEVEALRAIPVLEEKVSTLESDITRLREEKSALMSRLTKLASDTEPIVQPETVEKTLEAYLSEAANTEVPAPIESTCGCNEAETDETETMIESPVIDAIEAETSAPVDLPVEMSIEEKLTDVSPVEALPVLVVSEEAPAITEASIETPLSDALTIEEKIIEAPAETVATDVQPVEASPEDVAPIIVEAPLIETPSIDSQQVEIPATENPFVTEVVEAASPEAVQVDVSSQPQVAAPVIEEKAIDAPIIESNVEEPVEVKPETTLTATAPVETVTEAVDQTEQVPSEPLVTEVLTEVKSVDVVPAETVSVEVPTLVEERPLEAPSPVVTPIDEPSVGEMPIEDNLAEPTKDVVASVETLDEVISEMAKEIEEEKPVEETVSELPPTSISEQVQVLPIDVTKPESPTQEPEKSAETQAVEPALMEALNVEAPVVETVIAENPKVEELITETLSVDNQAHVANSVEIGTEMNAGDALKPSEEKKTELFVA